MTVIIRKSPFEWLSALGRFLLHRTDGTPIVPADAINDDGEVKVNVENFPATQQVSGSVAAVVTGAVDATIQPDNYVAYGSITTAAKIDGAGITFEDAVLVADAAEVAGMEITLPDGTRKLRIWTDADANYITLWVGGAAATGSAIPIPGASTWYEIDFDFSTNNAQVTAGNVVYITYGAALGAKTLILNAFARVV